jgi:serine/threonine-protein kinase
VHDAGEAAGTSFLVMDMVEGYSLRSFFGDDTVTTAEKVRWIQQIGDGLRAMHEAGLVHRDLKPENVIIRPDRSVCLVDLGIAKWAKFDLGLHQDPDLPPSDTDEAPATYAPPETPTTQVYDELGDQYAWGLIGYELLTGEVPKADSPRLSTREEVPSQVADTLDRARSTRREDRWKSMDQAANELRKLIEGGPQSQGKPASARPSAPAEDAGDDATSRRSHTMVIGALVLALVVVGGAVLALC